MGAFSYFRLYTSFNLFEDFIRFGNKIIKTKDWKKSF